MPWFIRAAFSVGCHWMGHGAGLVRKTQRQWPFGHDPATVSTGNSSRGFDQDLTGGSNPVTWSTGKPRRPSHEGSPQSVALARVDFGHFGKGAMPGPTVIMSSCFDSTVIARRDRCRVSPAMPSVAALGSAYLPAFAAGGAGPGLAEIGPALIGQDPTQPLAGQRGDGSRALRGHPYAKAPIDIACWDILGKKTGPARCTCCLADGA